MSGGVTRKWRPRLTLVIGGTLLAVFAMPVLGLTWLRLAGNILGWWETALLFMAVAFVASVVLAWLLWRLVLRPVWALTRHARAMKVVGQTAPAPDQFGTAELSDLGQSVIEMGTALQARARSLTAYADHVTHELKSPLTSLQGAADLLRDESLDATDRAALLHTIELSAARMDALLNDLRTHAAARLAAAPGTCVLSDAVAQVEPHLTVHVTTDGPVQMRVEDLCRVLTQLARNAMENGATHLDVRHLERGFQVSDDGTGIAQGDRSRVFDPFFTTRRDAGGTGMGLAIVRTLIEASGGTISLGDGPGAVFVITF